jgi:glutamate dehydrogenase (NAD(P)+)
MRLGLSRTRIIGGKMDDAFSFADDLGPAKIIHVHEPGIGLRGTLVVDNVATGPSIGGLRMAPDVSTEECFRLARAMTMKNAAAGLPHGGGKSVLYGDPTMPSDHKQDLVRAFSHALRNEADYIFGPDMGTDEGCMAWVKDEIGRSVGLPRELGGIPLDELGATAYGLRHCAEVALQAAGRELAGARVVVQGFGAVGSHAARFLAEAGCLIVAAADIHGGVADPNGLDVDAMLAHKREGGSVSQLPALVGIDCDIWIPAARPDVIHEGNVDALKAKWIVPGANIPLTPGAEKTLHERGVVYVPDFIANAGGVICAAMEYHGSTERAAFEVIAERIRANTATVLKDSERRGVLPSQAAHELAIHRVRDAMQLKRWSIF